LYFYISALVLLLGVEIKAAIHDRASCRKIRKEEHRSGYETPDTEDRSREDG
jgi:hypothetical protein